MIEAPLMALYLMMVGHALADYPLQGDWMARAKNVEESPIPGIWWNVMACHCLIHSFFVLLVTGSAALAAAEFFAHYAIDLAKCRKMFGYSTDQFLHFACKVAWMILMVAMDERSALVVEMNGGEY